MRGHQPHHGFAAVGNDDVFSGLCRLDKLRQPIFGFKDIDLRGLRIPKNLLAMNASIQSRNNQVMGSRCVRNFRFDSVGG